MSTPAEAAVKPIPPVAIPTWPGRRYADLIEAGLRDLHGSERDAVLRAMACAVDHYLAAMPGGAGQLDAGLDSALDEVLRLLPQMKPLQD